MRNLIGRHLAKTPESIDHRIVNHQTYLLGDRGPDIPV
jgi:hypothetical protein